MINSKETMIKTGALRDESIAGPAAREETGSHPFPGSAGCAESRSSWTLQPKLFPLPPRLDPAQPTSVTLDPTSLGAGPNINELRVYG